MMGPLLQQREHHPAAQSLERRFVFLTNGFGFDAYRDMAFGLFAYCRSLPTDDLAAFQQRAFLNPYGPTSVVSGPLFEQFLSNLSVSLEAIPDTLEPLSDERNLLLDFRSFRRAPVWRFRPDQYLCIDPFFVIEKLDAGFYWSLNKALEAEGEQSTRDFSSLWGYLVEDHVLAVLEHAIPPTTVDLIEAPARVVRSPFYDAPHEEAFDAVVLEGRHAVVIQTKGLFIKASQKYSGTRKPFFKGMAKTFGNRRGGAVEQLLRNIRHAFCIPRTRTMRDFPDTHVRYVWPLVVGLESMIDFGPAVHPLVQRFVRLADRLTPQLDTVICPVVFMQVEDLEVVVEHIRHGDFSLVQCLQAKLGYDRDHLYSFGDFYWGQFVPERALTFRRNAVVRETFDRIAGAALDRFRRGAYRDCTATEFGVTFRR